MILRFLDHLEEWLIAILMAAATLIIFVAVVHRYASGLAIPVVQDFLLGLNMSLGAGTLHLHVHLDGQDRCRLRCAHRHPRRRRRSDQRLQRDVAEASSSSSVCSPARCSPVIVADFAHRFVYELYGHRSGIGRSRVADVAGLHGHADRLVADVLPLSAGVLEVHPDRRVPPARPQPRSKASTWTPTR